MDEIVKSNDTHSPGCRFHPFPMSNLDQLGAFTEILFCHDSGSAGKHQSTTLGSLYAFWQAKVPKTIATQAVSCTKWVQTTVYPKEV